jgi:hypothetical protein
MGVEGWAVPAVWWWVEPIGWLAWPWVVGC